MMCLYYLLYMYFIYIQTGVFSTRSHCSFCGRIYTVGYKSLVIIPVINVVGNTALVRQKDPTDIAPLKLCGSFAMGGQYQSQYL